MAAQDRAFYGSEMKYLVEITSPGFSMQTDDFKIELKRGGNSKVFMKEDLVYREGNFYLCFDTTDFGPGTLTAIMTAYVPDDDFEDGIRTEVFKFDFMSVDK